MPPVPVRPKIYIKYKIGLFIHNLFLGCGSWGGAKFFFVFNCQYELRTCTHQRRKGGTIAYTNLNRLQHLLYVTQPWELTNMCYERRPYVASLFSIISFILFLFWFCSSHFFIFYWWRSNRRTNFFLPLYLFLFLSHQNRNRHLHPSEIFLRINWVNQILQLPKLRNISN